MPAYTVADAFIAWDSQLIGKHTQLQLNVNNLIDRKYYESTSGNLRVIEVSSACCISGPLSI